MMFFTKSLTYSRFSVICTNLRRAHFQIFRNYSNQMEVIIIESTAS